MSAVGSRNARRDEVRPSASSLAPSLGRTALQRSLRICDFTDDPDGWGQAMPAGSSELKHGIRAARKSCSDFCRMANHAFQKTHRHRQLRSSCHPIQAVEMTLDPFIVRRSPETGRESLLELLRVFDLYRLLGPMRSVLGEG